MHVPGWDVSKHLIITDEWRIHSHIIEHKEIHVYQDEANEDRMSKSLTRLKGVFGDLDAVPSTDLPRFDLRLEDKFDKETFTIEPCHSSSDSLIKKPRISKSFGSKLSLGSKTLLGSKQTLTSKLLGTIKSSADDSKQVIRNPTDSKKNSLNKIDLHEDKPDTIKTNKKAEKQDLELKPEVSPQVKPSKTKKKDDNMKD